MVVPNGTGTTIVGYLIEVAADIAKRMPFEAQV